MKKTLKIIVGVLMLVALLGQNVTVIAKASIDAVTESKSEKSTINATVENKESKNSEMTNSQKENTNTSNNNTSKKESTTEKNENKSQLSSNTTESTSKVQNENTNVTNSTATQAQNKKEEKSQSNNTVPTNTTINSSKANSNVKTDEKEQIEDEQSEKRNEISLLNAGNNEREIASISETPELKPGKLWVEINLRLPQTKCGFTVNVLKANEIVETISTPTEAIKDKLLGDENGKDFYKDLYYVSKDLTPGDDYSIQIEGPNYLTYVHSNIEIRSNNETKIKLTNGHDSDNVVSDVGVITLGFKDEQIIKKVIEQIESANPDLSYDLNKDGKVNIVDLSYVTINKQKDNVLGSTKHSLILNKDAMNNDTTQGQIVSDGNTTLNDILEDNGKAVTFAPAKSNEIISDINPIEVSLDLGQNALEETGAITIAPSENKENNITSGTVTVVTADGQIIEAQIVGTEPNTIINKVQTSSRAAIRTMSTTTPVTATVSKDPDGTIVINLSNKVAVKKVTIKVTGTESNKLADISKVEFLNNMTDRIPEPSMQVPTNVKGEATAEYLTISWDNMPNVTGYEVSVEADGVTEHHSVDGHTIKIQRFNSKDMDELHYKEFSIRVQSVNGEWRSGYSDPIVLIPTPSSKPAAPDNLKLTGKYREIDATWKAMKSTKTYNVYYREYESGSFRKVAEGLTSPSYTIKNLSEEVKKYQVYVTGVNEIGESDPSLISSVETISVQPAKLPAYKLINTSNGEGKLSNHIKKVTYVSEYGTMIGSPLDENNGVFRSALGTVDNSYSSYWQKEDWDDGASHIDPNSRGILYEFDNKYEMNYFALAQVESLGYIGKATVTYWDDAGNRKTVSASKVLTKTDENGRQYTTIKITDKINVDKVLIGIGRTSSYTRKLSVAEMRFYQYDDLEEQIDNLYEGQMHVTLKSDVTEAKIKELEDRLNKRDEVSGELHPEYDTLKAELDTAKEILANTSNFKPAVQIDTTVTSKKDGNVSFSSGINAWQPLGIVGYAGEQLTIYVGNKELNVGDNTPLQLIATQYDAEAASWHSVVTNNLKIGKNTVTIPSIQTLDFEKGGSLYINYTGNNPNETYAVRVVGGQEIPVLDLTKPGIDREAEIKKYVTKLEEYVPKLKEKHDQVHKGQKDKNGNLVSSINYEYNRETCILGATEIVLNEMMYSVSAEQILAGLGDGSTDVKAQKLSKSLQAMDEMMDLFYSHKGMSKEIKVGEKNSYPSGRQNIRYHRMFAGAAMYAGGLHIGIPWGDVQTLSKGNPIVTDENGKYVSGNYFGWGISHEIGHIINDSHYVHAEVTNNYFSVLSQAQDTNTSVRFEYPKVYQKVTSGKIGKADNVFTQLGLYWQLHLAYDKNGYNFKKYTTQQEQLDNLIFARIDTYARDVSKAPNKGTPLTLGSNTDNNLMRLACAATEKNLLDFFKRWGFVPDEETVKYASQWEAETRDIYYINDDARTYELQGQKQMVEGTKVIASADYQINYASDETKNDVKITLGNSNQAENEGAILGYEIVRSYLDNDKEVQRAVAFVTADNIYGEKPQDYNVEYTDNGIVYTDRIETINNRVITYKVTAIDKYLNKTEQLVLNPIKVKLDGSIVKNNWKIESNLVEENAQYIEGDNKTTCEPEKATEISKIANNIYTDDYQAKLPTDKDGEIIISLDEEKTLVGLKYKAGQGTAINDYEVYVSTNKENWNLVKQSKFNLNDSQETVYFNKENDDRFYTYRASYVKLVIKNQSDLSIAELDLLGESGDNIELYENGIGILNEQYSLGTNDETGKEEFIPAGSVVFTGEYKGNPAYNAIKLWDENNKIIQGYQVFFADDPKDGQLGEVSKGTWLYWVEPTDANYKEVAESIKTVRAELYRVDNALTNEGERLVSDTYRVAINRPLANIKIESNKTN